MYMRAPASLNPGGTFIFRDGSVGQIDAAGGLNVPAQFTNDAELAGFTIWFPAGLYQYNADSNNAAHTLAATSMAGAQENVVNLTGALGGAANLTLPTVAALVAAAPGIVVGQSFKLRIINSSSGAFAWTVVTATGWTLSGTMTLAQNTWRDFIVTVQSASAATIQAVGTGTQS